MGHKSYEYYTEGNTAKKLDYQQGRTARNSSKTKDSRYNSGSAAPKREYEEELPVPVRKKKQKSLSKQQRKELDKESSRARYRRMRSDSMSLKYVVFLSIMVLVSAFLSVSYLNSQAKVAQKKSNIHSLKSNIEVLSSQNDAISYDIDAYIDINRIIDIATNELGMIIANEEQVKYFQKNVDEFMNQYADVPDTD